MLHLCLSPCTGCRLWLTLSSRHWCLRIGSAPSYFHSLLRISLQKPEIYEWTTPRSTITDRLKITFQNILVHRSWLVEWSSHPYPECWSLTIFKRQLKTRLFCHYLIEMFRYPFFPSRYLGSGYRPIPSTDPIPGCVSGYTAVLLYY